MLQARARRIGGARNLGGGSLCIAYPPMGDHRFEIGELPRSAGTGHRWTRVRSNWRGQNSVSKASASEAKRERELANIELANLRPQKRVRSDILGRYVSPKPWLVAALLLWVTRYWSVIDQEPQTRSVD